MFKIDPYVFKEESLSKIRQLRHWNTDVGKNWPVVYIINDDKEAYIGETVSAVQRFEQHLMNPDRKKLTTVRIVSDKYFNKSVTLDLESFLISHMASDEKFSLQNGNGGLKNHAYYGKTQYASEFEKIWKALRRIGIVDHSISWIESQEIYKYSPYKSLGEEQLKTERNIVQTIANCNNKGEDATLVIRGGAGTGKTVLAIYLMKLFADIKQEKNQADIQIDDLIDDDPDTIFAAESLTGISKIGLVIPQDSLRASLKKVFKSVSNLETDMVLSPSDVAKNYNNTKDKYDLLIVDEAHRLKCRDKGNMAQHKSFDDCNKLLDLDPKKGTELDWIMKCSKNRILFRDELQTVRPCDIDGERFKSIIGIPDLEEVLSTQFRCDGGDEYVEYMKNILSCIDVKPKRFKNYDLRLYTNCAQMINDIKVKDAELGKGNDSGLCRNVAGFAWKWNKKRLQDNTIHIQGHSYRWNTTGKNWIGSPNALNEIGCIHTVQGYDLNYAGVIIGNDIMYDPNAKKIYAVKDNYYDQFGKSGVADDPDALCQYLCNIYLTLLTRGIKGTYIYVCDDELRKYFMQYIECYQ